MSDDEMKLSPEERWVLVRRRFQAMPLDLLSREIWELEKKEKALKSMLLRMQLRFWALQVLILGSAFVFGFCAVYLMLIRLGFPQILAGFVGSLWLLVLLLGSTDWTYGKLIVSQAQTKAEFEAALASNTERINLARDSFKSKTK